MTTLLTILLFSSILLPLVIYVIINAIKIRNKKIDREIILSEYVDNPKVFQHLGKMKDNEWEDLLAKKKKEFERKKIRNCHHEDFAHLVEKAFVGAGVDGSKVQYYRFKDNTELDMIAGRYNHANKFFYEAHMKMTAETLLFYVERLEEVINKPEIRISDIGKWLGIIKDRTNLLIEDDTAIKLASASFFDENEVLDGYDYAYNMKKIKIWKQEADKNPDFYAFFFIKPMSDLMPLPESWQKDFGLMRNYMALVEKEIASHTNINENPKK